MTSNGKAELRRTLSAKRRALTYLEQQQAARTLAINAARTRLFHVSRRIACYMPHDGEIDPTLLLERVWKMNKLAFLPVLSRSSHDRLWFAPATRDMKLRTNRYGIPEPQVKAEQLIRAQTLDLIFVPLLGIDAKGNRLGRGAGFYDRSLEFLRYRDYLRKPHLLGLAHDFQRVTDVPADAWDIPLDGVVTDRAVYYIGL